VAKLCPVYMEKKWFAIYTKPRWEKKVHLLLTEKELESYCPLNKVTKKWSDRMKTIEEPLFKSYVFVHITDEQKTDVRMTAGVVNFVYWQGKPAEVKDDEINIIRRFLNEHEQVRAEPIELKADQKVKIYSGVLMDHEARVIRVKGSYVEVVIESLGYRLVANIEKSNIGHI
jgi:transcription antitermination factor NusG